MFLTSSLKSLSLGRQASMQWCAQSHQQESKRDQNYTTNLTSSILFANPEEGT